MDRRLFYLPDLKTQANLLCCETPATTTEQHTIVIVPPLLEEMNACRRHIAEYAAQASLHGYKTLYFDLLGSGDSALELADINSLAMWQANIDTLLALATTPVTLIAIRSGVLLLSAQQLADWPVQLWQPELSGQRWVKAIRRAQHLMPQSPADPNDDFTDYQGYTIANSLLDEIAAVDLSSQLDPSRHTLQYVDGLAPLNSKLAMQTIASYAFWQHNERTDDTMQAWFDASLAKLATQTHHIAPRSAEHTSNTERQPKHSVTQSSQESIKCLPVNNRVIFVGQHDTDVAGVSVVFLPGRPQTRVGPHRLFVSLARQLAASGISATRVEYIGWGDGTGPAQTYQSPSAELTAVIRWLKQQKPNDHIVLCGLCDGATLSLLASPNECSGLILLNPFFDNDAAWSGALLEDHYLTQATDMQALLRHLKQPWLLPAKVAGLLKHWWQSKAPSPQSSTSPAISQLKSSSLPTLLCWSEHDLTAKQSQLQLQEWLNKPQQTVKLETIEHADHTFSNSSSQHQLFARILKFLNTI
ncbi:alpha/beta fold hydrolase [Neiella sp. HB171785]|uniref:Alpha/beta fold hydrolase n=1 Tax=Neiella litorisoli TaxID=2771431 RepID=A0A8J6QK06_9GAMM|nr:alpha/beta fold hydrolase [Neiella litorisoli]MBD1390579.1 alpha/beta fold hydrolase [Neiella litorisoli]